MSVSASRTTHPSEVKAQQASPAPIDPANDDDDEADIAAEGNKALLELHKGFA